MAKFAFGIEYFLDFLVKFRYHGLLETSIWRMITVIRLFLFLFLSFVPFANSEILTLPLEERPEWFREEGIVMAGSWEPLIFRVRRDGNESYVPAPEQIKAYEIEHSQEMIHRLKELGVNFIMMHCYKGFGTEHEKESMEDAVRFAKLCHDSGLHVGVYVYSGAFGWELFFQEIPEAEEWVILNDEKKPRRYGSTTYRYYWNRNHPDAQQFYKKIVKFAVNDIKTDLLHFDNYSVGPGTDKNSVERFRKYLRKTFTPDQLKKHGIENPDSVSPPFPKDSPALLRYAWDAFSCWSLSKSYHEMSHYGRSLREDVLVECNPGGVHERIRPPVHHGTLLTAGEAFWDEGRLPGFQNGELNTRICTYKVARRMNNTAFAYSTTPLEMAESMAFNLNCLGCILWFEYGKLVARPGSNEPVSEKLNPYIRFFNTRRDIFRETEVVADVAVLRSFASQVFANPKYAQLTSQVEELFIENRVPFQIVYDTQLDELKRYQYLVLAGCIALSDHQLTQIIQFTENGGKLCIVGDIAQYDEWMHPRESSAFASVPKQQLLRLDTSDNIVARLEDQYKNGPLLKITAPKGLCAELTEKEGKRFVHFVNYHFNQSIQNTDVTMQVPENNEVKSIRLTSPLRKNDLDLEFQIRRQTVEFVVPTIQRYEVAIVQFN